MPDPVMATADWLGHISVPKAGEGRSNRDLLVQPWVISSLERGTWSAAADGRLAVFVRGRVDRFIEAEADSSVSGRLFSVFDLPPGMLPCWEGRVSDLQRFAGPAIWKVSCPACCGTSTASKHVYCSWCDGEGEVEPEMSPGWLCGLSLNRVLLGRALAGVAEENLCAVAVGRPISCKEDHELAAWVIGRDWRVIVMGVRHVDDPESSFTAAPRFPDGGGGEANGS